MIDKTREANDDVPEMTQDAMSPAVPSVAVHRLNRALGPIAAGLVLDGLDIATFGPIGLVVGFPVGLVAGYWLGSSMGLTARASCVCAALAAVYCTLPGTELLPLATLVGALVRFEDSGAEQTSVQPDSPTGAPECHQPD